MNLLRAVASPSVANGYGRYRPSGLVMRRWAGRAAHVHDRFADCPETAEWLAVLEAARTMGHWRPGRALRLVELLNAWTDTLQTALGRPSPIAKDVEKAAWCAVHRHDYIRVGYTVREQPTATGKDLWLDVSVANLSDRRVQGWRSGRVHVRDVLPGEPDNATYGGGTGENYYLKPHGRFVWKFNWNILGEPFHVRSTGSFDVIRIGLSAASYRRPARICEYRVTPIQS